MASPTTPYVPRRRSFFAPLMLIIIGIVFLLVNMGQLTARTVFILFAKYWPLFIILWGLVKLYEHMRAKQTGAPAPGIGGGGVVFLIFLVLIGSATSAGYRHAQNVNWDAVKDELEINDSDFDGLFGQRFESTASLEQVFPAGSSLKVEVGRGAIKVLPGSDDKLHVSIRKVVNADNQQAADAKAKLIDPKITASGNEVTVSVAAGGEHNGPCFGDCRGGTTDLEITLPKKAAVNVSTDRGDIEVRGREGLVTAATSHGNVTAEDIVGNVEARVRGGDFTVSNITGDARLDGRVEDVKASNVAGSLSLNGEFMGQTEIKNVGKTVRFKSSRTDMELAKLDGELTLDSGDLRANNAAGPVRLETRSKDIRFEDVSGDVRVKNQNGEVELTLGSNAPLGNVEVENRQGAVRVTVPASANFQVDARALRGEIESDFNLNKTEDNKEARLEGTVNKGGPRLQLSTEHGTISILRNDSTKAKEAASEREQKSAENARKEAEKAAAKAEREAAKAAKQAEKAAKPNDE